MANSLWGKDEAPTTIYALVSRHEMRTYTSIGSLSAALSNQRHWHNELLVFDAVGKLTGKELKALYESFPRTEKKRSQKIADAIRSGILFSALKRGEM